MCILQLSGGEFETRYSSIERERVLSLPLFQVGLLQLSVADESSHIHVLRVSIDKLSQEQLWHDNLYHPYEL